MFIKNLFLFCCFCSPLLFSEMHKGESFALECDKYDPLSAMRNHFLVPYENGLPLVYLCGHSLGLQPKKTSDLMREELDAWASLGVEGHFKEEHGWYSYHTLVNHSLAKLLGALPEEVVAMNSLTVNLHLMMISFYIPTSKRYKILMEEPVFSSDTYAAKSQLSLHGLDPNDALLVIRPRAGEYILRTEDILNILDTQGDQIALVLFSAVNYFNGQYIDVPTITKKAHEKGCLIGLDLAHAIGNVPLHLHDWNVDFAVWCSYKYLNSGPGAIGGAFIHESHHQNAGLKRLCGWWGNNPSTRFHLHLQPDFIPVPNADGWQISNPSIFSLVPLRASLEHFDTASIEALREKSIKLTSYLEYLLADISPTLITIITPSDPMQRGCQISIQVKNNAKKLMLRLKNKGILCDFRNPDILRIAPVPLYNTFHDVWLFAQTLKNEIESLSEDKDSQTVDF